MFNIQLKIEVEQHLSNSSSEEVSDNLVSTLTW